MGKKIDLLSVQLHDADIIEINLKSNIDSLDIVEIILESDIFEEEFNSKRIKLTINQCIKIKLNMNAWIKGRDTVKDFFITDKSDWINSLEEFKATFIPRQKQIMHFCIISNTLSKIELLLTEDIVVKAI